jgi:hypothetical protein
VPVVVAQPNIRKGVIRVSLTMSVSLPLFPDSDGIAGVALRICAISGCSHPKIRINIALPTGAARMPVNALT